MSKLIHYSGPAGSYLLPSGYTRLSYILSTGTQWVNTGYVITSEKVTYSCKFLITELVSNSHIYGGNNNPNATMYKGNAYISGSNLYFYTGTTSQVSKPIVAGQIIDILQVLDSGTCSVYWQNKTPNTGTYSGSLKGGNSIALFHVNANGSWAITKGKMYNFKMWDNGQLVRDMVPVQKSDGTIGLLDLVNNTFYGNSGTGTFIAGSVCPLGFPTSEYCLVEWLESDGNAWIDTGRKYKSNTKVNLTLQLTKSSTTYGMIFGYADSNSWTPCGLATNSGHTALLFWGNGTLSNTTYPTNMSTVTITSNATSESNGNMAIFTIGGSPGNYNKENGLRVYRCLILEGTSVVLDWIPCYRRSNMVPGMYDIVGRLFKANAGSGSFLLGSSITFGWGEVVNGSPIGGCRYGLLATSFRTATNNGVTITANSNGTFTASGTATADVVMDIASTTGGMAVGKRYVVTGMKNSIGGYLRVPYGSNNDNGEGAIVTVTQNSGGIRFLCAKGKTVSGTFTVGVWDLDAMLLSHITTAKELALALGYSNTASIPYKEVDTRYWNYSAYPALPHNISTGDGKDGEKNGSFYFNGTDGLLQLPNPESLRLIFNSCTFSVAFWYKAESSSLPAMVRFGKDSSSSKCFLIHVPVGNSDNNTLLCFYSNDLKTTINAPAGTWHHMCCVVKASDKTRTIYFDGVQVALNTYSTALTIPADSDLIIGQDTIRNNYKYKGLMLNFQIFDSALDASDIAQII